MENTSTQNTTDIDTIPEGAELFLYSGPFDRAVAAITQKFSLSPEQTTLLKGMLFGVLTGTDNGLSEQILSQITKTGDEKKLLEQEVLTSVILPFVSFALTDENGNPPVAEPVQKGKMSGTDPVNIISDRLSQAVLTKPTKRDYSLQKTNNPQDPQKTFDPYREIPEV